MATQRYIKFFGAPWRADAGLRLCSAASRGVWIDCISLMIEAEPHGYLVVDGQPASAADVAGLTNTPIKIVTTALDELKRRNVYGVTDEGVIYSRRMVRDKAKQDEAKENGKAGGNPALTKKDKPQKPPDLTSGVNPKDKLTSGEPSSINHQEGSEAVASADPPPPSTSPLDLKAELWRRGLAFLETRGIPEARARPLLGKWRKSASDPAVIDALAKAEAESASDVVPFVEGCLRRSQNGKANGDQHGPGDDFRHGLASAALARVGPGDPDLPGLEPRGDPTGTRRA